MDSCFAEGGQLLNMRKYYIVHTVCVCVCIMGICRKDNSIPSNTKCVLEISLKGRCSFIFRTLQVDLAQVHMCMLFC